MRSIDVAEVISAAAASTLGVLSLIVLAVSFVGFNFFKRSSDGVKIGVWAVMLLAAVGFGFAVVRQGKAVAGQEPPDPVRASPTLAAAPSASPSAEPVALPAGSPAASSAEEPIDISGQWRDAAGFVYDVDARGGAFSYTQSLRGARTGSGGGRIVGRNLFYQYEYLRASTGTGTCSAVVSGGGRRIDAICQGGEEPWKVVIER